MKQPKIDLRFRLNPTGGTLSVKQPEGGDKAVASGYTRDEHNCGADIHLYYLIRKKLEAAGIYLSRIRVQEDRHFCHMFGDQFTCYLRTPIKQKSSMPHMWIYDPNWAIQSAGESYNLGEEVKFNVQGNIFQEEDKPPKQPDWWKKLHDLCISGGVPCELSKELKQELELCSIQS